MNSGLDAEVGNGMRWCDDGDGLREVPREGGAEVDRRFGDAEPEARRFGDAGDARLVTGASEVDRLLRTVRDPTPGGRGESSTADGRGRSSLERESNGTGGTPSTP